MKRFIKLLTVTCVAALAIAAMSAAGASAAPKFTASATGTLTGETTTDPGSKSTNHVFTIGGANVVTCKKIDVTGTIEKTESENQKATVTYTECSATFFGFPAGTVDIDPVEYNFTASGSVHLLNEPAIKATGLGCETKVTKGQTFTGITYTNSSGKIIQHATVSGIKSTSPNGCPSGESGTYTGSSLTSRATSGTISWDEK